jgi:mxaA protein
MTRTLRMPLTAWIMRAPRVLRVVFALGALVTMATTANGQAPPAGGSATHSARPALVQQPRPFGYFVGDLLTQRILLQDEGRVLTPVALPPVKRVSAWFERRRAAVETDSSLRRWLVVDYQVLNAPQKLTTVTLPAWELAVSPSRATAGPGVAHSGVTGPGAAASGVAKADPDAAGVRGRTLKIPATSINVAPLSPPGSPAQVGMQDVRPDRPPPPIPTARIRRAMTLSSGALVLTLVVWLGWLLWRNRRSVSTQPFARAQREMRRIDDRQPQAWQALHRAFDTTAGRVIHGATLPTLFERAPHLASLRTQIEKFFSQSSARFFGGSSCVEPISPRELCAELRRIERRHER